MKILFLVSNDEPGSDRVNPNNETLNKHDLLPIEIKKTTSELVFDEILKKVSDTPDLANISFADLLDLLDNQRQSGKEFVLLLADKIKSLNNTDAFLKEEILEHISENLVQNQATLHTKRNKPTTQNCLIQKLTPKENEIMGLTAEGFPFKEIAKQLFISPLTVRKHIRNIYEKLEVHSVVSAINMWKEMSVSV